MNLSHTGGWYTGPGVSRPQNIFTNSLEIFSQIQGMWSVAVWLWQLNLSITLQKTSLCIKYIIFNIIEQCALCLIISNCVRLLLQHCSNYDFSRTVDEIYNPFKCISTLLYFYFRTPFQVIVHLLIIYLSPHRSSGDSSPVFCLRDLCWFSVPAMFVWFEVHPRARCQGALHWTGRRN